MSEMEQVGEDMEEVAEEVGEELRVAEVYRVPFQLAEKQDRSGGGGLKVEPVPLRPSNVTR